MIVFRFATVLLRRPMNEGGPALRQQSGGAWPQFALGQELSRGMGRGASWHPICRGGRCSSAAHCGRGRRHSSSPGGGGGGAGSHRGVPTGFCPARRLECRSDPLGAASPYPCFAGRAACTAPVSAVTVSDRVARPWGLAAAAGLASRAAARGPEVVVFLFRGRPEEGRPKTQIDAALLIYAGPWTAFGYRWARSQ